MTYKERIKTVVHRLKWYRQSFKNWLAIKIFEKEINRISARRARTMANKDIENYLEKNIKQFQISNRISNIDMNQGGRPDAYVKEAMLRKILNELLTAGFLIIEEQDDTRTLSREIRMRIKAHKI